MQQRINEVRELLRKHDYLPSVRQSGDGVLVTMPHPTLVVPTRVRVVEGYGIKRGTDAGVYSNSLSDPTERFWSMPEYAVRMYIMGKIMVACHRLPISFMLVSYLDESGEERPGIEEIVDAPSDPEERSREGFLMGLITQAKGEGFAPQFEAVAETHGVLDGYRIIKTFFKDLNT